LAKEDPSKVREVLSAIASELVQLAEYLEPFLPDTAIKIRRIFANGKVDNSEGVLFPRIEK
jgi:methionyl-tRNA synthetase